MRLACLPVLAAVLLTAGAQTPPAPPLEDTRLSIHTLVREDVFAGVLDGDTDRLARGERSIDALLERRPADKPGLLAWKGGTKLYRAVVAHEAGRTKEFREGYAQAVDLLARAKKLGPTDPGAAAVTGGMYAVLADRLPGEQRGKAWEAAYDAYQALWREQARGVEKLPLHMRGELLAGLAQSAQRTGRAEELADFLDKILTVAPDTAYAKVAKKWKDNPAAAADTRMTCQGCHAPGRLDARRAALGDK